MAVSLFRSSYGYGPRPVVKVIGAETNYDRAILPFGVLQEVLRLQRPKPRRKTIQRPVTVKIYKDQGFHHQKKINYLRGVDNYYEFAGSNDQSLYGDTIYSGDAYSVLPYGRKEFMLVDKGGDEIVDLQYLKDKGIPRITKVDPIIIGNTVQEHIYLEVRK